MHEKYLTSYVNAPLDPIDERLKTFARIVERSFCRCYEELLTCTRTYNLRYSTLALGS